MFSAGWNVVVGTVGVGRALFFGFAGGGGDVGCGELELGFLFGSRVGAWRVAGEFVLQVLFICLRDGGREGREGGKDVVGYLEGLLGFRSEGGGEGYAVKLGWAM